jgi:hypothetical protein
MGKDRSGVAEEAPGSTVVARKGFFPVVMGRNVTVSEGGGAIFLARDEIEIERGGGQWLISLRELELEKGGGAVLVSGKAEVSDSVIGVLVSARTELKGNSRVLLTGGGAVALGVATGVAWALASFLLQRGAGRRSSSG